MLVSCHLVAQQQDNNGPAECRIVGGKDVVVHVGSRAVTLNDGQVVIVLGVSNGNATVKLQLQDGSVGIVQVPASCISKMERAPESTTLKTTQNTNIKGPGLPDPKVQPSESSNSTPATTLSPSAISKQKPSALEALKAPTMTISDPSRLKLLANARPGDVVMLKNGTWKDASLIVTKGGDEKRPLLIRAETPGQVVLCGASSLQLNAPYVTVDGLVFKEGGLRESKSNVIEMNSHHCILQNTAVIDYNPPTFKTTYHWVFIPGHHNLVNKCYFKGKNNQGPVIATKEPDCRYNSVTGCYFRDIPLMIKANGREIIKVVGEGHVSAGSQDGAFCTIEGNLFDHADGEGVEFISLKSNFNKVLGNTFVASAGCLNIRRGSYNELKDNVILGRAVERAQGIRMAGEHNVVEHNFISGCEYGIQISSGEYFAKALTPSYVVNDRDGTAENKATYPQNRLTTISGNTMACNTGPDLDIGVGEYKKHWPENQNVLIPEECLIEKNLCFRPRGGVSVIGQFPDLHAPLNQFTFKPNTYTDNVLYGGSVNFTPASSGFRQMPMPQGWTEEKAVSEFTPLTSSDVGPDWVIALRNEGHFPEENSQTESTPEIHKKKSKGTKAP